MTSLDPSHIPLFSEGKHTQVGAATYKVVRDDDSHHIKLPRLPDMRFEQSYLLSLKPFVSEAPEAQQPAKGGKEKAGRRALVNEGVLVESSGPYGVPIQIDWKGVAWVTIRDQVISPLIQGAVWGTASIFLIPLSAAIKKKLGRDGVSSARAPRPKQASPPKDASEVGWWRTWVRGFMGGVQTNTILK